MVPTRRCFCKQCDSREQGRQNACLVLPQREPSGRAESEAKGMASRWQRCDPVPAQSQCSPGPLWNDTALWNPAWAQEKEAAPHSPHSPHLLPFLHQGRVGRGLVSRWEAGGDGGPWAAETTGKPSKLLYHAWCSWGSGSLPLKCSLIQHNLIASHSR